ncbi:hypothetical protein [Streptomyces sp. NPDC059455]|uniref:hypothetical protein n=1 Tax=Streptomyces sp. NPDC059455 TaxID=3346837 RepID=UPI0036C7D5FC
MRFELRRDGTAAGRSGSFGLARPGEVDWAATRTDAATGAPADGHAHVRFVQ